MNHFHNNLTYQRAPHAKDRIALLLALAVLTASASAETVTLGASNGIGFSSFNTNLSWSNGAVPTAGNAHVVPAGLTLRTPADSTASHAFAADSLKLMSGAALNYKGITNANTITIGQLTLEGATVNNASNSSTAFILAGSIAIAGAGTTTLFSNNASITVTAPISGNSGTLALTTNNTLGRQVILSGANTYTGNITVTGNSGAVLSSAGKLAFAYQADNAGYNTITGAVPFEFSGTFVIDLTGASSDVGTAYTLVNTSTLVENFTATFTVEGWTKIGTLWVSPDGNYQFDPATGMLVRVETDSDLDGLPDSWEIAEFGSIAAYTGNDDPDLDYCSNLDEYFAFTDPTEIASFPDGDGDGLPNGWETFHFNSQAQTAEGDPDGDYATNLQEFLADTGPANRNSFPDADGDGISDGWEDHYFPVAGDCDPLADADGDLYDNLSEFSAATDPLQQISSPDSEPDGLPDGWEVKFFRAGSETLAETLAHTDGATDSDGDGRSNAVEYHGGTDPKSAASYPTALAYWRFEEKTAGLVAYPQVANAIVDVTGNGNGLSTWADYTAPTHNTRVAASIVTNTAAMNGSSAVFTAVDGNRYTCDNLYTGGAAPINSTVFTAFTVEASFRTTRTGLAQGIIGKGGNPTGAAAPYQAPFTLKLNAANKVVAGMVDGSLAARELVSARAITAGDWYSAAVTASSTTLSLWLKAPGDSAYVLEGTLPISGAWPAAGGAGTWVIGQTEYNAAGNFVGFDSFTGDLDEIRISGAALPSGKFLANVASSTPDSDSDGMDDAWEMANFKGSLDPTASGDFDHDGTTNLVEYLLGLNPASGSSVFAVSQTGNTLTWPAAAGLSFTVQRSTTLGPVWEDVATVVATGSTALWTDLAPPAGKAFYRVVLATE